MITINFPEFIGATLCKAKDDIRYYLNGIYISVDGDIVGSNGHIMFAGKCTNSYDIDVIISIKGKHPSKFNFVTIDTDTKLANFCDKDSQSLCMLQFDIVDGRYPNWKRIMNYSENKISEIGLDLSYMNIMSKIGKNYLKSGYNHQKVKFQDTSHAVHFEFSPTATAIIMPARVK